MTPDQRAALERLLEYVGRGFCAVQADCRMLREFLRRTEKRVTYKAKREPVVITLSLATCAQAPKTAKAPAKKAKAKR